MRFARFIWRNLMRNRRRSLLTALSLAVSIFIFVPLMSLADFPNMIGQAANRSRMVCHSKAAVRYGLPSAYRQKILAVPHIVAASSWSDPDLTYRDSSDHIPLTAIDHDAVKRLWPDWGVAPATLAALERTRSGCVVAPSLMSRYRWHQGQVIVLHSDAPAFDLSLTIVGVTGVQAPPFLFFRHDYLESLPLARKTVGVYLIRVDKPESVPEAIAQIDATFANSEFETSTEAEAAFLANLFANLTSFFVAARIIGIFVILAVTLMAANGAAMSIRERRHEIAILRAMGFAPTVVLSSLLAENTILAIAGGGFGSLAVMILERSVTPSIPGLPEGVVLIPGAILVLAMVLSALIGMVGALVPASYAVRSNISQALRAV